MKTSFADKTNGKPSKSERCSTIEAKKSKESQNSLKHKSPIKHEGSSSDSKRNLKVCGFYVPWHILSKTNIHIILELIFICRFL